MRYFLAIILPPVAVLLCGKPFTAILNLILTLFGWIPGMIHALFVVNSYKRSKDMRRIERTIMAAGRVSHRDSVEMLERQRDHH